MAETLCQKRALEAFRLDPAKWGGKDMFNLIMAREIVVLVKEFLRCFEFC